MELYPKSRFSELAISRSERFWLWLAESNSRWPRASWIIAIIWTGAFVAWRSDPPLIINLFTLASWCSVALCNISHTLLSILGRLSRDTNRSNESKRERDVDQNA